MMNLIAHRHKTVVQGSDLVSAPPHIEFIKFFSRNAD